MGASKRMCELVIKGLSERSPGTVYNAVRLKILEDALIAGDNYVGALQIVVQTFTPENRGRKRRVFEAQGLASGGLETGSFLHQTVRMLRRTLQVRMQRSTRL